MTTTTTNSRESRGVQNANRQNIGTVERSFSVGAGVALVLAGLSRRSPAAIAVSLAGAALVYRGVSGHCPLCESLGRARRNREVPPHDEPSTDEPSHVEASVPFQY